MRIRSPSLGELHAFIAVVETGSFSRAATRLFVTQGAVSRSVLRLEQRLGFELLERGARGVQATAGGQAYYDRIHGAVATLEAAVPEHSSHSARQPLRVCAASSLNMRWLVPRLPSLQIGNPGLQVVFKPYWKHDDMRREDVDCWIQVRPTSTSRWPSHIQARYLIGREIIPFCHQSVKHLVRTPAEVLRFPLLHHASYPDNWAVWCRAHGVDPRHIKLGPGFDLSAGIIEAVAANMGIGIAPRFMIEREIAEGRIAVPLELAASTGRGYYLCVPRARTETPEIAAFRNWLFAEAGSSPSP